VLLLLPTAYCELPTICCEGANCAAGIVWRYTFAMVKSAATNVDQSRGELKVAATRA